MDNRINQIADYLANNKLSSDLLPTDQPVSPTPPLIASVRMALVTTEAPILVMVAGPQCWMYMMGCPQWKQCLDPVMKHEEVLEGRLAVAIGADVITDAFAHPEEKRFKSNEFAVAAFSVNGQVCGAVKGIVDVRQELEESKQEQT